MRRQTVLVTITQVKFYQVLLILF